MYVFLGNMYVFLVNISKCVEVVHPHRYPHLGQCSFTNQCFYYLCVVRKNSYFLAQPLAHQRERLRANVIKVTNARIYYQYT